ncbi:MAG TPA: transferase [Polyangia bacterium]|jgi:Serine acetyltransferase|nr:transferase [Polyangia bacterium]
MTDHPSPEREAEQASRCDPSAKHGRPPVEIAIGDSNMNPGGIGLLPLLAEDFRTHGRSLLSPGFWILAVHRFGNWRMSIATRLLRAPMTAVYRTAYRSSYALWGIDLPYNVKVGRRVRLGHHGCMVLGAGEIGDDVVIQHSVTLGLSRRYDTKVPKIGNRVEIGPGACIVGGIRVGDGSYIGPNTVVNRDVPENSVALGIPMRLVSEAELTGAAPGTSKGPK